MKSIHLSSGSVAAQVSFTWSKGETPFTIKTLVLRHTDMLYKLHPVEGATPYPKVSQPIEARFAVDDTHSQANLPAFSRMLPRRRKIFIKLWEAALRWQKWDHFMIINWCWEKCEIWLSQLAQMLAALVTPHPTNDLILKYWYALQVIVSRIRNLNITVLAHLTVSIELSLSRKHWLQAPSQQHIKGLLNTPCWYLKLNIAL